MSDSRHRNPKDFFEFIENHPEELQTIKDLLVNEKDSPPIVTDLWKNQKFETQSSSPAPHTLLDIKKKYFVDKNQAYSLVQINTLPDKQKVQFVFVLRANVETTSKISLPISPQEMMELYNSSHVTPTPAAVSVPSAPPMSKKEIREEQKRLLETKLAHDGVGLPTLTLSEQDAYKEVGAKNPEMLAGHYIIAPAKMNNLLKPSDGYYFNVYLKIHSDNWKRGKEDGSYFLGNLCEYYVLKEDGKIYPTDGAARMQKNAQPIKDMRAEILSQIEQRKTEFEDLAKTPYYASYSHKLMEELALAKKNIETFQALPKAYQQKFDPTLNNTEQAEIKLKNSTPYDYIIRPSSENKSAKEGEYYFAIDINAKIGMASYRYYRAQDGKISGISAQGQLSSNVDLAKEISAHINECKQQDEKIEKLLLDDTTKLPDDNTKFQKKLEDEMETLLSKRSSVYFVWNEKKQDSLRDVQNALTHFKWAYDNHFDDLLLPAYGQLKTALEAVQRTSSDAFEASKGGLFGAKKHKTLDAANEVLGVLQDFEQHKQHKR